MAEEVFFRRTQTNAFRDRVTGGADAIVTLVVTPSARALRKICFVAVKYSATPVQAGVTAELDSGGGAAYDSTFFTGSANAIDTSWVPAGEILIPAGDQLKITAPAGGGVITASITVVTKEV